MRTMIVCVHVGSRCGEQLVQAPGGAVILGLRQHAARNAGLVGDYDGQESPPVDPGNGLRRTRQQADACRILEVASVLDDGAVPIQKYGTSFGWGVELSADWSAHETRTESTARATSGRQSSGRVRGSSSTRFSATRVTTAGVPSRRRSARPSGPRGPASRATSVVGSTAPGNAPPPTADSPGIVRAC